MKILHLDLSKRGLNDLRLHYPKLISWLFYKIIIIFYKNIILKIYTCVTNYIHLYIKQIFLH